MTEDVAPPIVRSTSRSNKNLQLLLDFPGSSTYLARVFSEKGPSDTDVWLMEANAGDPDEVEYGGLSDGSCSLYLAAIAEDYDGTSSIEFGQRIVHLPKKWQSRQRQFVRSVQDKTGQRCHSTEVRRSPPDTGPILCCLVEELKVSSSGPLFFYLQIWSLERTRRFGRLTGAHLEKEKQFAGRPSLIFQISNIWSADSSAEPAPHAYCCTYTYIQLIL